jgi:hypothetical protein
MFEGAKTEERRTAEDRRSLPLCGWAGVRVEFRVVYIARPFVFEPGKSAARAFPAHARTRAHDGCARF